MPLEKPADADHPIIDPIKARWSPRAFDERALEEGDLRSLFEAARWAPSAFNEQPWRFLVAARADEENFKKTLECLAGANQTWAQHAAVLVITVASTRFARNDKPNAHARHDLGLAMGQLSVQASALGIGLHQMAGFDPDKAREAFAIPDGFEAVTAVALGYFGEPDQLDDTLKERELAPRARRPQSDFVFTGRFGASR